MPQFTAERPLTFVTGNAGKLREFKQILGDSFPIVNLAVDTEEIQEETLEKISEAKCRQAAAAVNGPVLVEDTALCFNALGGLPGAYIKWFLQKLGHDGLNKMLAGFEDKSAEAVCTFAYSAGPGQEVKIFQGRTDGRIVPARGPANFGWDPIFEEKASGMTYAEMEKDQKNKCSHRGKALVKVREFLESA
ncbi:Ham1-like protein [Ascobolus immersus RN42]|uniref:Inosine triphosphate pyrophosphatase n=1 Tax=Ascobolus immersus RN42 TaxID=1160509 RepID=A0A3N4IQG9_ASCIM|nr:Ham1-like protein [Ascobolus immersus RN42]